MPPAQPPAHEREVVREAEASLWEEVLDRVRSLRAAVALVAVLAVAALGLAAWALRDERRGADSERVQALEDRVDELDLDLNRAASESDVSDLRQDQRALSERLSALEEAAEEPSRDARARDAIGELRRDVQALQQGLEELEQRVGALEQEQPASP
jgi:predicted  nucleic acid-binding Zn-ribbon protein